MTSSLVMSISSHLIGVMVGLTPALAVAQQVSLAGNESYSVVGNSGPVTITLNSPPEKFAYPNSYGLTVEQITAIAKQVERAHGDREAPSQRTLSRKLDEIGQRIRAVETLEARLLQSGEAKSKTERAESEQLKRAIAQLVRDAVDPRFDQIVERVDALLARLATREAESRHERIVWPWMVGGFGAASLITGGVFGLLAMRSDERARTRCADPSECDDTAALAAARRRDRQSTIADVTAGVGLVGLVVGIVGILRDGAVDEESPATTSATLVSTGNSFGIGLSGSF